MLSPPPGRFSTTKGCPIPLQLLGDQPGEHVAAAAGPSGMMIFTGRVGQFCAGDVGDCDVCAVAVAPSASQNAAARNASPRCTIVSPGWSEDCRSCDATAGPVGMESVKPANSVCPCGEGLGVGGRCYFCSWSSSRLPSTFESGRLWLLAFLHLACSSYPRTGHRVLTTTPTPTPPRPAASLPASGNREPRNPASRVLVGGRGAHRVCRSTDSISPVPALDPRDVGDGHDLGPFGDVLGNPRLESVRRGGHRFAAELPQTARSTAASARIARDLAH